MDVKEIRDKLGISQQELADRTGIPKDRIAKWEQGKGSPKVEDYNILAKIYEEVFPRGKEAAEKTPPYGLPEGTDLIETAADAKDYLQKRRAQKNHDTGPVMVPIVPIAAQAGYTKSYNNTDFINKLEVFPILPGIDSRGGIWRWFQVKGESMKPTFKEDQWVLASQLLKEDWRNIENFHVYVIITDEQVMIKRLAKVKGKDYWAAISDNEEDTPQFKLPVANVKELWKYRRHTDWNASPPKRFEIKV